MEQRVHTPRAWLFGAQRFRRVDTHGADHRWQRSQQRRRQEVSAGKVVILGSPGFTW
jgi:hypothetical protein